MLDDRHEIAPGLWQGAAPEPGEAVRQAGFDALVLCAQEIADHPAWAPDARPFPEVFVVYAGIGDGALTARELEVARYAAALVVARHRRGDAALITCAQGRNRSGLVMGLVLVDRFGLSGADAVRRIQSLRPRALTNPSFRRTLEML